MKASRTNFTGFIVQPICAIYSLYLGVHFVQSEWKNTLATLVLMTVIAVTVENLGNKLINSRLEKGRKERRAKEKAQMLADYAAIINKARPRKGKRRVSKRKKR